MVALDQPFAVAIEGVGAADIIGGRQAVDAGQPGNQAHVAPARLVEQLFGRDGEGRGEGLAGGRARGQEIVEKAPRAFTGVVAILVFQLLGKYPLLQPRQQLLAECADHPRLRKMDMAVDEARQDQPLADVANIETGMPARHFVERSEIGNAPIVDHQQAVGMKAGGCLFVADMLPGIVDEVEERAADADACHGSP